MVWHIEQVIQLLETILQKLLIIIWVLKNQIKSPEKNNLNKSEFYKSNNSYQGAGHPAYVFKEIKDDYVYLDITHSKFVKNKRVAGEYYEYKKLNKNPNSEDEKISYISPFPYKANKKYFKNKVDWQFSELDKDKIERFKNKKVH